MNVKLSVSNRWVVLALSLIIISVSFAVTNSFPVFYPTIVQTFGWSRANTALMYSINSIVFGICSPISGILVDRFGPRPVITTGALLLGSGFALCSTATSEWHFYLFFGVLAAIGLSLCGWVPLVATLSSWFKDKLGLAFGILAAGWGVSLICAPLFQYMISTLQWQTTYLIIGIFAIVTIFPIGFFMHRKPSSGEVELSTAGKGNQKLNNSHRVEKTGKGTEGQAASWTFLKLIKLPVFWLFFLANLLSIGFAETIPVTNLNYLFQDIGYNPMAAASIFSTFGFAFTAGNFLSPLSDRLGREKTFTIFSVLCILCLPILFIVDNTSSTWLLVLFSIIYGMGIGSLAPVFTAALVERFGGRHIGYVTGVCGFGYCMGNAIAPWLAGFIHDITDSYFIILAINVFVLLLGPIFLWMAASRKDTLVQE